MDSSDISADAPGTTARRRSPSTGRQAVIGESITIQGELTGDEDLTIQGHVDGSVNLDDHAVTVGPEGKVEADIVARVITVEGTVEGDLDADDQIVLRGSARVEGDLSAPRVNLEDGSYFRGAVDMGEKGRSDGRPAAGSSSTGSPSASPSRSSASAGDAAGAQAGGDEEEKEEGREA